MANPRNSPGSLERRDRERGTVRREETLPAMLALEMERPESEQLKSLWRLRQGKEKQSPQPPLGRHCG